MSQSELGKAVTVKKHTFDSITDAAKHFNVPLSTAARRLQSGWTPEQAFNITPPPPRKSIAKKAGATESAKKEAVKSNQKRGEKPSGRRKTLALQTHGRKAKDVQSLAQQNKERTTNVRTKGKPVEFNGEIYPSLSALAREFDVPRHTLQNAINKGESLQELLKPTPVEETPVKAKKTANPVAKKNARNKPIEFQGETYPSLSALAREFKVPRHTLQNAINRGESLESVLAPEPAQKKTVKKTQAKSNKSLIDSQDKRRNNPVEFQGEKYASERALSAAFGIPHATFYQRVKRGWTIEEALGIDKKSRAETSKRNNAPRAKPLSVGKKEYPSIKAAAEAHKIPAYRVTQRLKHGWTPEEALGLKSRESKVNTTAISFKCRGKSYRSVGAFCREFNLTPQHVSYHMLKGRTPEEILDRHEGKSAKKTGLLSIKDLAPFKVAGETFHTAAQLARHFGKDTAKVTGRLRNGWSAEKAVDLDSGDDEQMDTKAEAKTTQAKSSSSVPKPSKIVVDGQPFNSVKEVARAYSLDYQLLLKRSKEDLPLHHVVMEMTGQYKKKASSTDISDEDLVINGKQYSSLSEVAREFKMPYPRLRGRIKNGMTLAEAVQMKLYDRKPGKAKSKGTLSKTSSRSVRHGSVEYVSVEEFSALFELDPIVVSRRLDNGWSPEQILGEANPPNWM